MSWFGEPWPSAAERAPVCEDSNQRVTTPVGQACGFCAETVADGDRGTFFLTGEPCHAECSLREVLGGAGHLAAEPHAAGACDFDGGLTRRRSALLVSEWVGRMGVENLIGASRFPIVRKAMQAELDTWRSAS